MCIIYSFYNFILQPVQKAAASYLLLPSSSYCDSTSPQMPFGSKADSTLVSQINFQLFPFSLLLVPVLTLIPCFYPLDTVQGWIKLSNNIRK